MQENTATKEELLNQIEALRRRVDQLESQHTTSATLTPEEKYQDLFENAPVAYFSVDADGLIQQANQQALNLLKTSKETLIGQPVFNLYANTPNGKEKAHTLFKQLTNGEPIDNEEMEIVRADGTYKWVSLTAQPLTSHNGRLIKSRAVLVDITERKQAIQTLRNQKGLFEKTLHNLEDAVFVLDANTTKIIDCNLAASTIFGYSRQEMLGCTPAFLHLNKEHLEKFRSYLYPAIEKEGVLSGLKFQMKRKNNTIFPTEHNVVALKDEQNNIISWVSVVRDITQQVRLESEIAESKEQYEAMVNTSPSSIMVVQDNRYVFTNPAGARMLGYRNPQEVIGCKIMDTISPAYHETIRQRIKAIATGQANPPVNLELIRSDGSTIIVETTSTPIMYKGKQAALIVGQDITQHRQTTRALRLSQERYRQIFETNQAVKIVIDPSDGRIVEANQAACRFYGYPLDVLTTMYILDINTLSPAEIKKEMDRAVQTESLFFNFKHRLASGEERDVEVYSGPVKTAEKTLLYSIVHDVTEQKKAQAALRDSEKRFRTLVESVDDIVFTLNAQQQYTGIFGTWLTRYSFSPELFLGKTAAELFSDPQQIETHQRANAIALQGQHTTYEWSNIASDGNKLYFQTALSPLKDDSGQVTGIVGISRDVTQRKVTEQTLNFVAQRGWQLNDVSYLKALVQYLADTLGVDYAFVGQLNPNDNSVTTLAMYAMGNIVENIKYDLAYTPCEQIIDRELCIHTQNVQALFPQDHLLQEMGIEGYAGMPLWDSSGKPLGIIVLLHSTTLTNLPLLESLLQIVAMRTAHELELQQTLTTLRQSEQRFRSYFELPLIGIAINRPDYSWIDFNDKICEMIGYTRQELMNTRWPDITHPEDLEKDLHLFQQILDGQKDGYSLEKRYIHKNGTIIYAEISLRSVRNQAGAIDYLVTVIQDISERKQAEQQLHRRNTELSLLNRIIAVSASSINPHKILRFTCRELALAFNLPVTSATLINPNGNTATIVAEYTSDPAKAVLGETIPVTENDSYQYLLQHKEPLLIQNPQTHPQTRTVHHLIKQRQSATLLLVPLTAEGNVIGSLALDSNEIRHFSDSEINLVWNIANQISGALIRARLSETSRRLLTAIEQTRESVIITDANSKIIYVNPAFERISGYSFAEVQGKNPRIVKSGQQSTQFYEQMWDTLTAGKVWHGQLINKNKSGALYTEETTITPIKDKNGVITNYIALKKDITKELQLQEQYRQAQRMESVGRLAGGIAHDFNNILTVIIGHSEILQSLHYTPDDPRYQEVSQIKKAADKASMLTRQLLTFSRQQPLQSQSLNLNDAVATLEKMLHRLIGEDISLITNLDPKLSLINADPGQLEQIIMNLAINARDAMPTGGKLTISTANVTLTPDLAEQYPNLSSGPYVTLSIADTGIGMDSKTAARIYEPFFTTKTVGKGTGLGLSIVYGIVEQNDGHIQVKSTPNQGTTFTVFLPQSSKQKHPTTRPHTSPLSTSLSGIETIILVEDETAVRLITRKFLQMHGYTVLEAATAQAALEICNQYKGKVDLLITDVIMPNISGPKLAKELLGKYPDLKVLFISGYTDTEISEYGAPFTTMHLLQKPFSSDMLARKVKEVLQAPHPKIVTNT